MNSRRPSYWPAIAGWTWLICLTTALATWLLQALDWNVPLWWQRTIVIAAAVASGWILVNLIGRLWRQDPSEVPTSTSRVILLLTLAALLVQWMGIDFEITGRYYRDEGIYFAAAEAINEGDVLPQSFIYGHLPYYLYAQALWVQGLFPQTLERIAAGLFDIESQTDLSWLLMRGLNATLGALTVIPVFIAGNAIQGVVAGVLGAALVILSPMYGEITRLIISDAPSAFFATLCVMFVALLTGRERRRDYLLAGVAAGLAAACKYPAGVVAVAIVAIWLWWRVRQRDVNTYLLQAGAVSLACFLLVMPAFWAHGDTAFAGEGKDLLFGLRQYGKGGWIGVMPASNSVWYVQQLGGSFGWPAMVLGLLGWPLLASENRRRFLLLTPFPVTFIALLAAMSMVVKRNLLPVVPTLAVLLGLGVTGWALQARRRWPSRWKVQAALIGCLTLAVPLYRTTVQTVAMVRPSTRDQASEWIAATFPRGAGVIQESYTPHLHFKKYAVRKTRFAGRLSLEEIRDPQWDFLVLAGNAFGRFLEPENWSKPHHELYAQRYRAMQEMELAAEFLPGPMRLGPSLYIYRIDPESLEYLDARDFELGDPGFRFPRDDAFLLLKEYFDAGVYDFELESEPASGEGRVEIVTRDNEPVGTFEVLEGHALIDLPQRDKYFFFVYMSAGDKLRRVSLVRQREAS